MNDNTTPVTPFSTGLIVNWLAVWLIERMKASQAPALQWISKNTPWVSRILSVLFATLTAAGFTINFDQSQGVLTIAGLTLHGLATFLTLIVQNVVFQHVIFKATAAKPSVSATTLNITNVATGEPKKE